MARWTKGWFKLWRDAWEKDLGDNLALWALWHALLTMATWKESQILWKGRQRIIPPGTVVLGMNEIADRWRISPRTVSKWLHHLNDTGRIVLETCGRGTVITICNWEKYQCTEDEVCAPSADGVRTDCAPASHGVRLKEEGKNVESKNEVKASSSGVESHEPKPRKGRAKRGGELPKLARIWNEHSGDLPKVLGCNGLRLRHASVRWEEHPSEEFWIDLISRILRSDFCTGKNDRGWKADFDFLIKPDTQNKVLEGKFDNRHRQSATSGGFQREENLDNAITQLMKEATHGTV